MSIDNIVNILNPQQPHCATVLLLDTSSSMDVDSINHVNDGLKIFKEEVLKDELTRKRVEQHPLIHKIKWETN